jgi:transcriptional regulator with XRE-family HTH domain
MNTFVDRLKYAMSRKKMKQADLVEITGIGKSSISQYLSGQYMPKQKNLYLIAKALDVNEDWLIGNSDDIDRNYIYLSPDSEMMNILEKISVKENIPLDLLIDAFYLNTNYLKINPIQGLEDINYEDILASVKKALNNRLSEVLKESNKNNDFFNALKLLGYDIEYISWITPPPDYSLSDKECYSIKYNDNLLYISTEEYLKFAKDIKSYIRFKILELEEKHIND